MLSMGEVYGREGGGGKAEGRMQRAECRKKPAAHFCILPSDRYLKFKMQKRPAFHFAFQTSDAID
jgi:hypothetical protein